MSRETLSISGSGTEIQHFIKKTVLLVLVAFSLVAVFFFSFWFQKETSYSNPVILFNNVSLNSGNLSPSAKIVAVGDMQFDRYIRQVGDERGRDFIFSCADPLLRSADFVVGNLEGPITANASVSIGTVSGTPKNYVFTFPTTTAETLSAHNIGAVNIGNNHINNQGGVGITATRQFLALAGVGYFGGIGGDEPVYRATINGILFSFVSYNQFGGNSPEKVAAVIAAEHLAGRVVIVYAHWGDEYSTLVDALRPVAVLFAENGADAIIGSHPHVVLPSEYIGNTLVYYSLGNFIFDQYWDASVTNGLAVELYIKNSGEKITATETAVTLERDGRTCPSFAAE